MGHTTISLWVGFNLLVLLLLAFDLGIVNRKAHVIRLKEAIFWSVFWTLIALLFNAVIYFWKGPVTALEFLTGYILERSLSVDNLFVFILLFGYFKVSSHYQHKVLFWGILGALIFRAIFIMTGITLIRHFHWILYVFGAFLIFTGGKLVFQKEEEVRPERNPILRIFRRFVPVTQNYREGKFFVKEEGRWWATPLFVVLIIVETTDVVFAVDSIPAILAITLDPFIVYTSNVFAILGLRALYFALAGIMELFHFLNYGLAVILVFVGVKMILADFYKIPIPWALGVIAAILALSIVASLLFPRNKPLTEAGEK